MQYVSLDPIEIIAGTSSKTTPAYLEAAKTVSGDTQKSMAYLKGFAKSIEKAAAGSNVNTKMIVSTAGNLSRLSHFKTINDSLGYLEKHCPTNADVKALRIMMEALQKYNSDYEDAYKNNVKVVTFEYEAAVTTLIMGVSYVISTAIDVSVDSEGRIVISKVPNTGPKSLISKTIQDMSSTLNSSNHGKYLKDIIELKVKSHSIETHTESVQEKTENILAWFDVIWKYGRKGAGGIVQLTNMIIKSAFGILPLIRSAIYLFWKSKADHMVALNTQVEFISLNVAQLELKQNIPPAKKMEIIKKQNAMIEVYKKKAEKIKAQLGEAEYSAKKELSEDDIKSDDLVLD